MSDIIHLILASIILPGLAWMAAWALGLLVGINMAFGGSALLALDAREIDPRSTTLALSGVAFALRLTGLGQ